MSEKLRVGITHGDINGVGYEVILKAFENPVMMDLCTPIVYGSPWSGKHGLDRNISVPLCGICLLERGAENRIVPLEGQQMLAMLQHQAYQPLAQQEVKVTLKLIERLVQQVPFWHMHCTKDPVAAHVAYEAMKKA